MAEPKVSYSRIWLWFHRTALNYTTNLPVGEGESPTAHDQLLWPPRPQLGLQEAPDSSASPQTGQFGRSEAEAKLHRFGLDPGTATASCEAIRGPHHGSLDLALPDRPRPPPESLQG